jgi:hypothetical protein
VCNPHPLQLAPTIDGFEPKAALSLFRAFVLAHALPFLLMERMARLRIGATH